jgi:hypothetical protein
MQYRIQTMFIHGFQMEKDKLTFYHPLISLNYM